MNVPPPSITQSIASRAPLVLCTRHTVGIEAPQNSRCNTAAGTLCTVHVSIGREYTELSPKKHLMMRGYWGGELGEGEKEEGELVGGRGPSRGVARVRDGDEDGSMSY